MHITTKKIALERMLDESVFRFCYIVSLFLSLLCFVELGFQILTGVLMAWSVLILANRFKSQVQRKNIRNFWLLSAFMVSGVVTAFLHAQDNLGMNLLMMYHVALCFFLFYGMHAEPDREKIKREMWQTAKALVLLTTVIGTIGLLLAFTFVRIEAFSYVAGLMDNRFTGLYTNPNLAAFAGVIGIVCCQLVYRRPDAYDSSKKLVPNFICYACVAVNLLAVLLSDSNSSMVFLVVDGTVLLFTRMYRKNAEAGVKKLLLKTIAVLLVCAAATAGLYALRTASQAATAAAINGLHHSNISYDVATTATESSIVIGRTGNYEISSGRLDSLEKSMVLFAKNPMMGVGKGNILEYGNRYLARGFQFFDLHNGYLTILISCGIVGLSLFLIFALRVCKKVSVTAFRRRSKDGDRELVVLFAAVCAYAVYALFERALLFDITFMVVVFWLLLGYLMTEVTRGEEVAVGQKAKRKELADTVPALTRRTGNDIIY